MANTKAQILDFRRTLKDLAGRLAKEQLEQQKGPPDQASASEPAPESGDLSR